MAKRVVKVGYLDSPVILSTVADYVAEFEDELGPHRALWFWDLMRLLVRIISPETILITDYWEGWIEELRK